MGNPEPQRRTHPAGPPPPGTLGVLLVIQGGTTSRAFRAPDNLRRPPAPKRLGPRSCSPVPSSRPTPLLVAEQAHRDCWPPGANSNPRSATEGPIPRHLSLQRLRLGTPEPQHQTLPCCPGTTRAARCAAGHSGQENGQGFPSPRRQSKASRAKTLGPTLPLASAHISACPSAPCTFGGPGRLASWGNPHLGRTPKRPSQGAWRHNVGIGDPPSPSTRLTCRPAGTRAAMGVAGRSGREDGQGPPSPWRP